MGRGSLWEKEKCGSEVWISTALLWTELFTTGAVDVDENGFIEETLELAIDEKAELVELTTDELLRDELSATEITVGVSFLASQPVTNTTEHKTAAIKRFLEK